MAEPTTHPVPTAQWRRGCLDDAWRGPILHRLRAFRTCGWLAVPLALGNLAAVYYGWTVYYVAQFGRTAPPLWPFVSDSPNAVLAFALVLLAGVAGLRWAGLDLLAWVLNVKVGVWTVFVLLHWHDDFFAVDPGLRWFLFWLHVGMVAQAFALHRDLRARPPRRPVFAAVAGLVLLDWVLDYAPGLSLHPTLPGGPYTYLSVAGLVTGAMVLGSLAAAWALYRPAAGASVEAAAWASVSGGDHP